MDPLKKTGFKALRVKEDAGKIIYFKVLMKPRKLDALIQCEIELRTEIHLTLGSDLITYGLDKFFSILKGLTGRGDQPVSSTLKYDVIRLNPQLTEEEKRRIEKRYYKKVNAPVGKFLDALGPRVRKVREFMKDADQVVESEIREVAAKEIVDRLKKTTADFGFDLDRLTKRTGDLLGHVVDIIGEPDPLQTKAQLYQAVIRKKAAQTDVEKKPQLIIFQQENELQIMGGSNLDPRFADINPELLFDTLRLYLLTKRPKKATPKK